MSNVISYNIISPDGFPFNREPFETIESSLDQHVQNTFNKIKFRYHKQGYYSSNDGRIPLEDLHHYCDFEIL